MLSNTVKSQINSKLKNIYSKNFNNKDLRIFSDEIFELIKISNKKILKAKTKKLKISEDTSVVICYGDSVYENGKINSIKSFKNFYNKNLSRYFNTIHFLPFYPSSSDSGFAVKDHYKIDSKLGSWADINNFSKKNNIMADKDLFSQQSLFINVFIRRKKRRVNSNINVNKISPGDFIVHKNHGIGKFLKIEKINITGDSRDYLVIQYQDGKISVAADQLGSVNRYRSSGKIKPKINKLGGTEWERIKDKNKKQIKKVAFDILKLYAKREKLKGYIYPEDGPWQDELEESFPYQPTPDQITAVEEIKSDMESDKPMDRLVCGDVGFGKTEVAVRAIFKAITSGKQVILLAPTTILAQQHWRTINNRFSPYPIKVSLLNRFKTVNERKEI